MKYRMQDRDFSSDRFEYGEIGEQEITSVGAYMEQANRRFAASEGATSAEIGGGSGASEGHWVRRGGHIVVLGS